MSNLQISHEAKAGADLGRRRALARLGLMMAAVYTAPLLLNLNQASASGGGGGGGGGGG
ncbi:MAG: hypothetical protein HQL43_13835, partial [Alphaproteobacteria bacterium]|nr:hypothetical protein [Alphaproteobacteria bacterium]